MIPQLRTLSRRLRLRALLAHQRSHVDVYASAWGSASVISFTVRRPSTRACLLAWLLLAGCATIVAGSGRSREPRSAPIELRTLDGRPARLDEVARGRPALVSLWATWCEPCAREFDALAALARGDARGAAPP